MTFDTKTGVLILSAEMTVETYETVINVPKEKILLGSTMYNPNLPGKI